MTFDILICCKPQDTNKLPFLMNSIKKNIVGYNKIYIVTPDINISFTNLDEHTRGFHIYSDFQVIPVQFKTGIKYRPNWIFQQYIKLFQDITACDNYLVIDADVYINKPLEIFTDGKPNFFIGTVEQEHKPYFRFMEKFNVHKVRPHTFICELMLFNKKYIQEWLQRNKYTIELFLSYSNSIITSDCHLSEFEFYGNMIARDYPDAYGYRAIKTNQNALERPFTEKEIQDTINNPAVNDLDIITYHTWED